MIDSGSVSRRPLDFEDYTDIARRNIRWIIGPVVFGLVVSTVVAFLIQDTFVSKALIRIVPQQISDTLVQNASAQDMTDRMNGMYQNIVSRTTLANLIQTYSLYKTEQKSEPLQDVIEKMKTAITVRPTLGVTNLQGKGLPAMEVSYKYRDPLLANKVCADLVSRFLNASSVDTLDSQVQTNVFLKDETDKAKADLDRLEQQLSDYQAKHAGALPEEMQGNFQQMNVVEQRLNNLSDSATRISEKKMTIESNLRIVKDHLAAVRTVASASPARSERAIELDKEITTLETSIAEMKDKYTAENPDLQSAQEALGALRRQRDEANKSAASPKNPDAESPAQARERIDAQAQIEALENQLSAANLEELRNKADIQTANGQLRALQARLESNPGGIREYSDLLRDRETAKQKFLDLDARMHKSTISMDLERRKQGETLELIDAPTLPQNPTEPNRLLIIPLGAVGGLLIGLILIAIREVKDTSLKNLKDARVYTQLAILGSIPLLENDVVVQRRKQVMLVSWAMATVLAIAIIVGSVAHYYLNRA